MESMDGVPVTELMDSASLQLVEFHAPNDILARSIRLISDIDDILDVAPDSVVLMPDDIALGGWTVSVALHYLWERRAAALVVPNQVLSETVIELARRFNIGLFASHKEMVDTAINIAHELGALQARATSRLNAFGAQLQKAASLDEALTLISDQMQGSRVEVTTAGVTIASVGERSDEAVQVQSPIDTEATFTELSADVARSDIERAKRLLDVSKSAVHSLLAMQELANARAAAPLLAIAALGGDADLAVLADPLPSHAGLRWPISSTYASVCLRVARTPSTTVQLAPAVLAVWQSAFPGVPLLRSETSWFAYVPCASERRTLIERLEAEIAGPLQRIGIAIGVSLIGEDKAAATTRAAESWLAARIASPNGDVVEFNRIAKKLVGRALTSEDAHRLAALYFPRLLEDAGADELISATVALLDCGGNATLAAARIGVHRNTLQSRVRRASELGVELNNPENLLAVHLILTGLARESRAHEVTASTPSHIFPR